MNRKEEIWAEINDKFDKIMAMLAEWSDVPSNVAEMKTDMDVIQLDIVSIKQSLNISD